MKGENRLKILELIKDSGQTLGDLLFVFTLPYGTSLRKIEYLIAQKHKEKTSRKNSKEQQRRFYDLIYHLREDNLIENTNKNGKLLIKLTNKGQEVLTKLRKRQETALPAYSYASESDGVLKIVIFDIPEKERKKRLWLCAALRNLNFTMLQKSVWVGKTKLPDEFIHNLNELHMISFVEIFAISKTGSLKKLIS